MYDGPALPNSVSGDATAPRWTAKMVRPLSDKGVGTPASFVRKRFTLDTVSGGEILRISALGLYRCLINGKRVGRDVLTPGWTNYDARLSYQTYGVADLLEPGPNSIEIWLADGWLRSQLLWPPKMVFNVWGEHIAAIAELRADATADAPVLLATDTSWESGEAPIRKSGIYFGEIYDARIVPTASAGTKELPFDTATLIAHETTPVRELAPLPAERSWTDAQGRTIHDFGQNCGGYVAFTVTGESGAKVVVEHAEILDGDGVFDNANYGSAAARVEYVLASSGAESYRPHFTFHGFRYARMTIEGKAKMLSIASIPITSLGEAKAAFTSGNRLVNRLVQNTLWSQRSNFIEVPTDCPQRAERLGWTGDAQVFAGTACYLADTHSFFRKYLRDMLVDQREDGAIAHFTPNVARLRPEAFPNAAGSTGWGDAICIIPWTLWLHYGDSAILAETLPAMVRWVDFVWSISDGPIVSPPRDWGARGFSFGDWLQPGGPSERPLPTIGDDAAATISLFIASQLTARIADRLGESGTAERMSARAATVKAAFAREFITASGRLVYDDQTSYALAFLHDLIPAEHVVAARRYFKAAIARVDGRIGTGFIGTPALLPALVKIGESELAARVFLQEEVPGWLYQVKLGATTIWERWDAIRADGSVFDSVMNSYNHYAYGAVCQFLFESVAGFRPDPEDPAFAHIIYEPVIIPALSPVSAHHDSVAGRVAAAWRVEGERVYYTLTVPEGSKGTLVLAETYDDIVIDGTPRASMAGEKTRCPLTSGPHAVSFRLNSL